MSDNDPGAAPIEYFFERTISFAHDFWSFLNSNFITAFFGAVFGSATILLINHIQKKHETLAEVNASIAILSGLMNSYLMVKKQHAKPTLEAYKSDVKNFHEAVDGKKESVALQAYLKKYHCPDLSYELPTKNILSLAGKHAYIVPYLMRAKKSVGEVEEACRLWNSSAETLFNLEGQDRLPAYLGLRKKDGIRDTSFPDVIENLNQSVDDALYFTDLAILALQKFGKNALPRILRSKVIKYEIHDAEYKILMPPKNHKPGWGDDLR